MIGKVLNNLLEFLAKLICIQIDIAEGWMDTHDFCLSLENNTSVVGQICKSNFCDKHQAPYKEVAHHQASLYIENNVGIYAQHFKEIWNVVADSLLCDYYNPADILIRLLRYLLPSQIDQNFHTSPVLPEIELQLYKMLQLSS